VAIVARLVGTALQLGLETALALVLGLAVGAVVALRPGSSRARRWRPGTRSGSDHPPRCAAHARPAAGDRRGEHRRHHVVVVTALLLGTWLARRFALVPPLSALVTVGMAICGNSAILALSPIIGAKHRDTAYAVSTITVFGLIGVLLLPVVGRLLHLSDPVFGTWAGLAVNDTAQVVATGYAFSPGPATWPRS
jgi:hypothetical protein